MLDIHAPTRRPLAILDLTYNTGRMWHGCPYTDPRLARIYTNDLYPVCQTDYQADYLHLQGAQLDRLYDVLVWDPPMVPNAGTNGLVGGAGWASYYGTLAPGLKGYLSVRHLFAPTLAGARQHLLPDGILVAKMANIVHGGQMQWQCDWLRADAHRLGWCADDAVAVPHLGSIMPYNGLGRRVLHTRRARSELITLRLRARY